MNFYYVSLYIAIRMIKSSLVFSYSCRRKQYSTLLELLKKFQTCRSLLRSTIQKAEQAISDKASYMGKDNLQRSMAKVGVFALCLNIF